MICKIRSSLLEDCQVLTVCESKCQSKPDGQDEYAKDSKYWALFSWSGSSLSVSQTLNVIFNI
jgi:hypothetical protein